MVRADWRSDLQVQLFVAAPFGFLDADSMAEEYGYFQGRNPCKKTKLGNGGDVFDGRPLEPEEALRLMAALDGDEPLRTMAEVAMFTD